MKFHISKRDTLSWQKAVLIRVIAILLAVGLIAILCMSVTGQDPSSVFASIFEGAFGTARRTWITLQQLSVLLIISLALTPAFKMQFWNIGGEGQVLVGALAAASCMLKLGDKLPNPVVIIIMTIASILAGAIWGFIPALFKALWNTNETLSTLMMNYIATQLVAFYTIVWEVPKGSGQIGIINSSTQAGWLPELFNRYGLPICIAVLCTAGMLIYLKYSKHGYEITVVGESKNTARYVGINVEKVIIRTMLVSGGMCGLAGLLLCGGINHTVTTSIAGGMGFTAVMVSWLAKFNPITMIFTSLLIVFMNRGASEVATSCGLNESFSDIMTGIILFFIIGCEFFIRYKINRTQKTGKEA